MSEQEFYEDVSELIKIHEMVRDRIIEDIDEIEKFHKSYQESMSKLSDEVKVTDSAARGHLFTLPRQMMLTTTFMMQTYKYMSIAISSQNTMIKLLAMIEKRLKFIGERLDERGL